MEKSLILHPDKKRRRCNEKTEVTKILRKCETLRTTEESRILESATDIVKQILKRKDRQLEIKERVLEKEDPPDVIEIKARELAEVISRARHLVCYTGAGISTSARIPDYRGSQGIWTLLQQGKDIGKHDLSLAEPTRTHMALNELHRRNILRFVVSQNCDGLHLRSGLPRKSLSEVHGNMYVEVCKSCKTNVEYWRLFDTTELTARYYHKTNRRCHLCGTALVDTIVHFGERGSLRWPLNWDGAIHHADKADVILCLGSSLKVLKKYSRLWSMNKQKSKRPKIYIVNLQWTPKDSASSMKINGKCDEVMELVMKYMNIKVPAYNRQKDPIFAHATLLAPEEMHTRSQPMLQGHTEANQDTSDSADDDSKDKIVNPILRSDTQLSNSMNDYLVPKAIVTNESDAQSSDERLSTTHLHDDEETSATTTSEETHLESKLGATCPDKFSTNGALSLTNGTPFNGNGCIIEKAIQDKLSEVICDKKPTAHPAPMSNVEPQNDENDVRPKLSDRHRDCSSIKSRSPTKCLLNNVKGNDKHLIDYYHSPHYAYPGLHSIIYTPPTEVDMWRSDIIPIIQLNRSDAECDFCFDNYAEHHCQFYRPKTTEFLVTSCRNGRLILCECCDYTDGSDNENVLEYPAAKRAKLESEFIKEDKESAKIQAGWYGKGYRKMFRRKRRA
ncbi:hypothetical protein HA402_013016 [Bradysia odoriphaga]|nr:hypothetical protein HA402_013016 [Bradysia odoriphaga]